MSEEEDKQYKMKRAIELFIDGVNCTLVVELFCFNLYMWFVHATFLFLLNVNIVLIIFLLKSLQNLFEV